MRLLLLCVMALILGFSAAGAARTPEEVSRGLGLASALLADPSTGNLLTVHTAGTSIRQNNDGSWTAHAVTPMAVVELIRAGHEPGPDLSGLGRVVVNGRFEPDDPASPLAGGRWDLEQLTVMLQAELIDADGNRWSYTAHIGARDGNFTRFDSALDPL